MTPDSNLIGPRVRAARLSNKLTESDLAKHCLKADVNLTAEEITEIEEQKRSVSDFELLALAKALEISGTSLRFGDGPLPWEKS